MTPLLALLCLNGKCAGPYEQCGRGEHDDWSGPTCCTDSFACNVKSSYYSQCEPVPVCENKEYDQCGGTIHGEPWGNRSTCCVDGYKCVKDVNVNYDQCQPDGAVTQCAEGWGQCDGKVGNEPWPGPFCCTDGYECKFKQPYFSQCVPLCTQEPFDQCGGKDYAGETCCPKGYSCVFDNPYFSGCRYNDSLAGDVEAAPAAATPAAAAAAVPGASLLASAAGAAGATTSTPSASPASYSGLLVVAVGVVALAVGAAAGWLGKKVQYEQL